MHFKMHFLNALFNCILKCMFKCILNCIFKMHLKVQLKNAFKKFTNSMPKINAKVLIYLFKRINLFPNKASPPPRPIVIITINFDYFFSLIHSSQDTNV